MRIHVSLCPKLLRWHCDLHTTHINTRSVFFSTIVYTRMTCYVNVTSTQLRVLFFFSYVAHDAYKKPSKQAHAKIA